MTFFSMRSPMQGKYAAKAAHGGARRVGKDFFPIQLYTAQIVIGIL